MYRGKKNIHHGRILFLVDSFPVFIFFSQLRQTVFAEFLNLDPTGKFRKISHNAKLIGQFMRGNFFFDKFTDCF